MRIRGGGSAGAAGYGFQARLIALIQVHILAEEPLGWLLGEGSDRPDAVSSETRGPGDDIRIELANGGGIYEVQAKRRLSMGEHFNAVIDKFAAGLTQDPTSQCILVVGPSSSPSIRDELAVDLDRIRQGRDDQLYPISRDLLHYLTDKGIADPLMLVKRMSVRECAIEKPLGERVVQLQLRQLLADPAQTASAWKILVEDGHDLIVLKGRRDRPALIHLLRTQHQIDLHPSLLSASYEGQGADPKNIPVYPNRGERIDIDQAPSPAPMQSVAWSPDGTRLAFAGEYGIRVRDVGAQCTLFTYSRPVLTVLWSPNGKVLTSFGGADQLVRHWNAANGTLRSVYPRDGRKMYAMAWSPNGRRVAFSAAGAVFPTGKHADKIWVRDTATGKPLFDYPAASHYSTTLVWSPDGTRIAALVEPHRIQVRDVSTKEVLFSYPHAHDLSVHALAWSPDGSRLASSAIDASREDRSAIEVHDAATGELLYSFPGAAYALAWSPDGKWLAIGGEGIQIWEADTQTLIYTYRRHLKQVHAVAWSPDGAVIASGSDDGALHVWRVKEPLPSTAHLPGSPIASTPEPPQSRSTALPPLWRRLLNLPTLAAWVAVLPVPMAGIFYSSKVIIGNIGGSISNNIWLALMIGEMILLVLLVSGLSFKSVPHLSSLQPASSVLGNSKRKAIIGKLNRLIDFRDRFFDILGGLDLVFVLFLSIWFHSWLVAFGGGLSTVLLFLLGASLLSWRWQGILAAIFGSLWGAFWWAIAIWVPGGILSLGWPPLLFAGLGLVGGGVGHVLFFQERLLVKLLGKTHIRG